MSGTSPSSERWPLIESLFERASDLPEAERDAFLERECIHDEDARHEVEALLRADRAADGILDRPLESAAGAVLATPAGTGDAAPAGALPPGTLIDVYRVVRELGHGGMGAVYLAERADGAYSQQVALKIVRGGLIAAALERRFLRERQILARLQHPNIARLLDGGFTQERLPYLAMEYVEGETLTRWADSRSLDVEQRLRLFLEVCEAVQYAHRQLVVHRDLKPANILVTGEGRVRLLDFGIARLLDDTAEEGEALTRTGFLLLTPEYAAPEQVRGDAATTATDVYSLGAVLYELLSGKKAYEFGSHSLTEILRVLDQDIPLLAHRPDLSKALRRQLSGDLETIVHRALARESERRYPSAEALAADVRRHLEHRPVEARPDSLGYRLAKYLRRNRLAVSAAAALLIAIGIGVTATIWQAREARREAVRAQAMSELLYGSFAAVDPESAKGRTVSAREILDAAAKRIDAVQDPSVRVGVLRTIGELYMKLSLYEPADALLTRARDEATALYGPRSAERGEVLNIQAKMLIEKGDYAGVEVAAAEARAIGQALDRVDIARDGLWTLANVAEFTHEWEKSEALWREALAIDTRTLGAETPEVGHEMTNLGYVLGRRGANAEAEETLQRACALLERTAGRLSENTANCIAALGFLYRQTGRLPEAEKYQREELDIRTRLYGPEHHRVAQSLNQLAGHIVMQGRHADAVPLAEKSLAIRRRLFGQTPHAEVADTLNTLGVLEYSLGDLQKALAYQTEVVDIDRVVFGNDSVALAAALGNLGRFQRDAGDYATAERTLNEALALRTRTGQAELADFAISLTHLAHTYRMQDRLAEAEREYRRADAIFSKTLTADNPRVADARTGLAAVLVNTGRSAEAVAMLEEARQTLENKVTGDDIRKAEADLWLGVGLARLGSTRDAQPRLESARQMLTRLRGADNRWTKLAAQELAKLSR